MGSLNWRGSFLAQRMSAGWFHAPWRPQRFFSRSPTCPLGREGLFFLSNTG
jgi:hypothetical protein